MPEHVILGRVDLPENEGLVLRFDEGQVQPYCVCRQGPDGNFYWGHYYTNKEAAKQKFVSLLESTWLR